MGIKLVEQIAYMPTKWSRVQDDAALVVLPLTDTLPLTQMVEDEKERLEELVEDWQAYVDGREVAWVRVWVAN